MPTYEYECDACGHRFDQFQSITAKTLRKCPECGRLKLRRLIGTGGAVIFKGGGFYETDYRSEGYRKAKEADRRSTDAKPAAETTSGGSSGDAGAPGKTETSKAASGDASGKGDGSKAGSSASSSSGASGDAAGTSKRSAGSADRGTSAAGTSGPAKKASGKRHAREGRGVGNLKTAARSRSTKKSGRRGRA